ncbi:MAG: hypothetical protein ACREOD_04690 [Candidatus Dormibacteria bacterium]
MPAAAVRSRAPASAAIWPAVARIAFGLILLLDAVLEWQPGTYQVFPSLLYGNAAVSPEPLRTVITFAATLVGRQPVVANAVLAALETGLGLCVAAGLATELALIALLPLILGVWVFGEGLGLAFSPGATDLGAGAAYLLCIIVLLRARCWSRLSLDRLVARGRLGRAAVGVGAALAALLLALGGWGSARAIEAGPGQSGPPAVGGANLVLDPALDQDLLFGGCGQLVCSRGTWLWNGRGWLSRAGPSPGALGYAAAAYDPRRRGVVLFGGAAAQGVGAPRAGTWRWDTSWQRLELASAPTGRRFAAAGFDPDSGQLLVFGGDSASARPLAGTWVLRPAGWVRLHPARQPSRRSASALAWDPRNGELLLFGGSNGSRRLRDTWAWDGSDWTELHPRHSPPALAYEAMATDPLTGTVLLFAGAGARPSTWEWTGSDWRAVVGARGPASFSFAAMAEAPHGRGVLLFGGATSSGQGFTDQTWLWTGRWQRLAG